MGVERIPPGLRCDFGEGSFVVHPDATDWLVLLGESSAGGFAATGPLLLMIAIGTRRKWRPNTRVALPDSAAV